MRKLPSKGGIFSRVAQVLDFSKHHSRLGPSPGEYPRLDRPTRVFTEPNSPNTNPYPTSHKIWERVSTPPITTPEISGQRTPRFFPTHICGPMHRNNVFTRFSCPLPITSARIDITMDAINISAREDLFTWAAVEISANVNISGELDTQIGCEVPLDIMIFVDNSWVFLAQISLIIADWPTRASMSPALLKGVCRTVLHLASSIDILVDRLAIGCISADPEQNMQLLLPLSTCNLDAIRGLLQSVQIFELHGNEPCQMRTSKALHEASNLLLRYSSRGALRHLFVVTANSSISLSEISPNISSRVRFHTVSPEPALGIWASEPKDGWHLSVSFNDEEDKEAVHSLKENLKQIMRHLRYGLDPGVLSNLSIELNGQNGYEIEAILGDTKCTALRPGEKWTLLVKIRAVSEAMEVSCGHGVLTKGDLERGDSWAKNQADNCIHQTIDQFHGLLGPPDRAAAENNFSVRLEHSHSALSSSAVIKLENKCEVARISRNDAMFGQKIRQTLPKDVRKLYIEGITVQGRAKPIHSMHLSCHLDNDNHGEPEQGENSSELPFAHSPLEILPDLELHNSPLVELGSLNPFRNLVRGCDDRCFHNLSPDGKISGEQAFISPIT